MAAKDKEDKKPKAEDIEDKTLDELSTKPVGEVEEDELSTETIDNPDAAEDASDDSDGDEDDDKKKGSKWHKITGKFNPYLVLFVAVVLIAILVIIVVNRAEDQARQESIDFTGTELNQTSLNDILENETNVGTVDETLTIAANAIFNGKILVKDSLDVAGTINVGGSLSLPGITVAGQSAFEDVSVENNLTILGGATIQQGLTIQEGLNVAGNAEIGGSLSAAAITTDSIVFRGDLNIDAHINTNGGTPAISAGTGVGGGGTVSISGNDVSGTVTVNTGGGPSAGILARITFVRAYIDTPRVQLTPVNGNSGSLDYYVERTTGTFSIGSSGAPNGGTTYSFDYFITE